MRRTWWLVGIFFLLGCSANVALAQQLSRLGPDRQNPLLTIGAEYRNRISVKCP